MKLVNQVPEKWARIALAVSATMLFIPAGLRLSLAWSLGFILAPVIYAAWRYHRYARESGRKAWSAITFVEFLKGSPPLGGINPPPVFFFSYTRDSVQSAEDERDLSGFYRELDIQVGQLLTHRRLTTCSVWDRSLREGSVWRVKLLQALNSCRVLVAACSPGYDASENCAQEYQFLIARAALQRGEARLPIVKVQWLPGGGRSGLLAELQDESEAPHPAYGELGLRFLKLSDPALYRTIVHEKARQIAALISKEDPYYWDIPPSFAPTVIPWKEGLAAASRLWREPIRQKEPVSQSPGPVAAVRRAPIAAVVVVVVLVAAASARAVVLGGSVLVIDPILNRFTTGDYSGSSREIEGSSRFCGALRWLRPPAAWSVTVCDVARILRENSPLASDDSRAAHGNSR